MNGSGDAPVLRADGIVKRFGATTALDSADFSISPGETVGLVGANGAGKSTLVKVLSGALTPDEGRILIDGEEYPALTPRLAQHLGITTIYQHPSLVPSLGLAENIILGREPKRAGFLLSRQQARAAAREHLDRVGLADHRGLTAGDLSPAGRQMLEIAKALHRESRIVYMDEPTAALGEAESARLFEVIQSLTESGIAVVYISHRLDEVLAINQRVVVMREGRSVFDAPTRDLDEDALIRQMIGHEVKRLKVSDRSHGKVALALENVGQGDLIRDVSFEVREGEVLGVTGLVGSGRSRITRLIFGAEQADRGRMVLFGETFAPRSPHDAIARGVGFAPEDRTSDALLMEQSAAKNVTLARLPSRVGGVLRLGKEERDARQWIERLEVKPRSTAALPSQMSGGNQQKIVIGRWSYADARLMIFDEPGQGVDIGAKEQILRVIRELAEQGRAVIVVSQELEELEQIADRVLVMRRGEVTGILDSSELSEERVVALAMGTSGSGRTAA